MSAIFNIVTSSFFTSMAILGAGTFINKVGIFMKTYEEEKGDSYKKAFDKTMILTIEELNFCIDSMKRIVSSTGKAGYLLSDIMMGNKVVQKDKSGKILITEKSKLYNQYEDTISDLSSKVKQYQEELEKMKKISRVSKKKRKVESSEDEKESSSEDEIPSQYQNRHTKKPIDENESEEEFTLENKS